MNEHFKRILDEATARLDTSLKEAQNAVVRAKKEMTALAEFGETLPHTLLDKFNMIMTGEQQFDGGNWYQSTVSLRVGGYHEIPLGIEIKQPLRGKYRAIVLLQKLD